VFYPIKLTELTDEKTQVVKERAVAKCHNNSDRKYL
jgi:hypothetical protein